MSLINDRDKVKQVIDFTGVQNGAMHPSDIDAVLEFDGQILILIEVKYQGSPIPTGQKLLLERICDSWHDAVKRSIVLKVEHKFRDSKKNIPLNECFVTEFYYNKQWKTLKRKQKFVAYINKLGKLFENDKCKF